MPIIGRITVNGLATQFSAKVEVNPDFWNVKAGKAIGRTVEVQEVNNVLDSIKSTMTKIYRDLQERESNVTPERIKNIFFGIEVKYQMLLELFKRYNDDIFKLIGVSKSQVTYHKYEVTRKRLTSFIKDKYNVSDISLKEINLMFLSDFEAYLRVDRGCNANTTAKFMQRLKSIVLVAKNNGWIHTDPYANYKIKVPKVDRGYLTQEDLNTSGSSSIVTSSGTIPTKTSGFPTYGRKRKMTPTRCFNSTAIPWTNTGKAIQYLRVL